MSNTVKKPTKRAILGAIEKMLKSDEAAGVELASSEITYDVMYEFISHEYDLLDNKAAAAAKRATAKKIAGDELREKIYGVLTDEPQSIAEIVEALNDPDVTAAMVTARLTQLASDEVGKAIKDTIVVEPTTEGGKSRKVSAYRLA